MGMDGIVAEGGEDQDRLVTAALRLALAEKLELEPSELEGLDREAAAAALDHFVQFGTGPERLQEWLEGDGQDDRGRALIAHGVRQALSYELGVRPDQLQRMNLLGAAHTLDRIRSRRLGARAETTPVVRSSKPEDDRRLVGRILCDALAEQLEVPPEVLKTLSPNLAAHILATLIALRRRTRLQALPSASAAAPVPPDRRDLVARVVRDAIAQDIELHPRLLGSLDATAAAVLLGRFVEARRAMDSLRTNMVTDELTGALRRSAGEYALGQEISRIQRVDGGGLAIAFIDIDALKAVNDSLGHQAGDKLLRALVETLRARLRSYDSVARWGGDEFLVILPQTDLDEAEAIMAQVWHLFQEARDQRFSYGLAALNPGETVPELVARADAALYERKRMGPRTASSPPTVATGEASEATAPIPSSGPVPISGGWSRFGRWLKTFSKAD
jgi:diguanylate cyclase (GGDEF)-like protein